MEARELSKQIGRILRRLRKQRSWTLNQMALVTGVSKPMLGQIERGDTNPTVVTLWKITSGLNVPFSVFLQGFEQPRVHLIPHQGQAVVEDDDGAYVVRSVVAVREPHPSDMFQILLRPGGQHKSESHGETVYEAIWVQTGQLRLAIDGEDYTLNAGDAVQFAADTIHVYRNPGITDCTFLVMLVYGQEHPQTQVP